MLVGRRVEYFVLELNNTTIEIDLQTMKSNLLEA